MRVRRFWVVVSGAFLIVAALAVVGSAVAITTAGGSSGVEAVSLAGSSPLQPTCAQNANCGAAGALVGGCTTWGAATCSSALSSEQPAIYRWVVMPEVRHLPFGVRAELLRPPQAS